MEGIVTTIISSGCILIGTIITVIVTNSKLRTELELKQKYQQTQINELKDSLKEHNNYAKSIPVIETEIEFIKQSLQDVKNETK